MLVCWDRDRPWQAYPVTIITGAYIGYAIGCEVGRTPLVYGKRIDFGGSDEVSQQGSQEIAQEAVNSTAK